MKKLITILALLIAASTMSAQPINPLLSKGRTYEREAVSTHERTLPESKTLKTAKPNAHKGSVVKQITTATLKLDSIINLDMMKLEFEYDNLGRIITLFDRYVGIDMRFKCEYTYNTQNQKTQERQYSQDMPNAQWEIEMKAEYTYNVQGNLTLYVYSSWDADLNQWINDSKQEYTYNAQGNLTLEVSSEWDADLTQWINSHKTEYTYNAQGNLTLEVQYEWDEDLTQWINDSKQESTYNAQGNQTLCIGYEWDTDLTQWINSYKDEYTYNAQGNLTLYIGYGWDMELAQWINDFKNESTYDAQGNLTLSFGYNWNSTLNNWDREGKEEYTYNLSYTWDDIIFPRIFVIFDTVGNIVLNNIYYSWDETLSDWGEPSATTYHYSEIETSIANHPQHNISVYPNPVQERLYIKTEQPIAQLQVYDLSGRLLLEECNVSHSISVAHLTPGVYLVKAAGSAWKIVKN